MGNDTVTYAGASAAVNVPAGQRRHHDTGRSSGPYGADAFVPVENLVGSAFDDKLKGSSGASHIDGGAGNDQIGGDSSYIGSSGDVLKGGAGDDYLANGYFQETTGTASDSYNDDGGEDALRQLAPAGLAASPAYVGHGRPDPRQQQSEPDQLCDGGRRRRRPSPASSAAFLWRVRLGLDPARAPAARPC